MLGSVEKGREAFETLDNISIKTPFEPEPVINAGRNLLAFGLEAGKNFTNLEKTIRQIGDVAAGTSQPLEALTTIYGQVLAKGKLQGEEILQLAERGVPIVKELAAMYGKSEAEIFKMSSAGQIGFAEFEKVFARMTGEGGKFAGMMEKLSESAGGMLSTVRGYIGSLQRSWGIAMVEMVEPVLRLLLPILERVAEFFKSEQGIAVIKVVMPILIPLVGVLFAAAAYAAAEAMGLLAASTWAAFSAVASFAAPVLAVAAALTGLYLIVEDLWYFARGGGSAFESFLVMLGFEPATIEMIRGHMAAFFDSVGAGVDWLAEAFGAIPWKWVIGGILAVVAIAMWPWTLMIGGIILAIRYWDDITKFIGAAIDWILDAAVFAGKVLFYALFPIALVYGFWDEIVAVALGFIDFLAGAPGNASSMLYWIVDAFWAALAWLGESAGEALEYLLELGLQIMASLFPVETVSDFWDDLMNYVRSGINRVIDLARRYGKLVIMYLFPLSALYFYWDEIEAFFSEMPQRILDALNRSQADLKSWVDENLPGVVKLVQTVRGESSTAPLIEARASGGPVTAGNPYRVGEEGEELFVPDRNGKIISNRELQSRGSVASRRGKSVVMHVTQHFHLSGEATQNDLSKLRKVLRDSSAEMFRKAKTALEIDEDEPEGLPA